MTLATPDRTAEGWIVVDSERRNDDPWANDDCWHRDAYTVYTVRGTRIRIEEQTNDGIGQTWDRLEETMRAHGLTGTIELVGHGAKGLGYRVIHTIATQAELDAGRAAYLASVRDYSDYRDYED